MAGGVGIYISSSLNAIHRSDLSFEAESCWIEILQEHKPIAYNCGMYRVYTGTPNLDNFFLSQLENLVSSLNQSKHQVFILGDRHEY